MNRVLGFLLLCLLGSHALANTQYAPVDVPMELQKVSEHVWAVTGEPGAATDNAGFISNAGFVVTDAGVVVFDALGTPSLAARLLQHIRSVTDQPVVRVITSHYHADHIYGLQVFKEQGAEVWAPFGAGEYLGSPNSVVLLEERQFLLDPWVNESTYLVVPDQIIEQGQSFSLGGLDFEISYLGSAHSDGDLAMLVKQDRVMFSGDIIFEGRVPFVGNGDTRHWLATLEGLGTTGLHALVPGHGPVSFKPDAVINLTRDYLAHLRQAMGGAVEEMMDFAEAYDAADWEAFSNLPAFEEANRINAYQVFLSLEAELLAE